MSQEPVTADPAPPRSKSELGEAWLDRIISDAIANGLSATELLSIVSAILGTLIAQNILRPHWAGAMATCFQRALDTAAIVHENTPAPAKPL